MPSTSSERAARWPEGDRQAIDYLKGHGFVLTREWFWKLPPGRYKEDGTPLGDNPLTEKEHDAIMYLIEEWDFGGWI